MAVWGSESMIIARDISVLARSDVARISSVQASGGARTYLALSLSSELEVSLVNGRIEVPLTLERIY
eukprot:CAMPEP_0185173950 /NCGR_PEP_ID=MMETSP1139-20130426/24360_1 /TAXON_ID=298111 /ORGANISM="Pavlova sp., Strain CCMP459" /LENGTH=66 /DNA_ID=CAMNT_0027739657 /DNA_START=92 /DNA_END=290 /DNA_ORIENTATION=+